MKTEPLHILIGIVAALAVTLASGDEQARLAIDGYSPVSYFESGQAEKGQPEHKTQYNQRTYHFTDAEQLARFEANPQKYEPLFPNHCPYNLALGRQVAIDPTNFKILDGNLLLFHKSEEMDGLEQWESHDDERELLERARGNYTLFEF